MSIYGYNFNAGSSKAYYLSRGWNTFGASFSTSNVLDWNTRCLCDVYGGFTAISPMLPSAVTSCRVKTSIMQTTYKSGGWCSPLMLLDSDLGYQLSLYFTAAGAITLYRGNKGTLLATSEDGIVPVAATFNLEMLATIDETDGLVRVWLNGVEISELQYSGNTQNTDNANIRYFGLLGKGDSSLSFWNDFVIDDAPTDTILGNCYAKTRTIASVSSNTGFTAEGDETDIPTILNQTSPDGTDYIEASADGDSITLALEPGDEDDTDIRALCITALAQKNGDGDCNGTLSATVNDTTTSGDETALSNGYTSLSVNVTGGLSSDYADAATITLARSE